ncbi:hypothetical protein QE152_g3907 [Popillia japonica]|uniref:Uncharacterized protein n=1 Tax=Popillia japonica TaxID=7064 RepID=A0AAW1N2K8_POPJA
MYMWALLLLILSRFSLLLSTDYYYLLGCAAFLGLAKGFRTVYWSLVIPNYVPIERLAAALGLYSTLNGTFIWIGGPFLGFIRDVTGSYKKCIFVINTVTSITLTMWIAEFIYLRYKKRKEDVIEGVK